MVTSSLIAMAKWAVDNIYILYIYTYKHVFFKNVSFSNNITFIKTATKPRKTSWRTAVSDWRNWTSSSDFRRLGWRDFFVLTVLLSTFISFFLPSSPLSLIVLFLCCCSHAKVFGRERTLVHEFLFSYSHTEWNLLFLSPIPCSPMTWGYMG